MAIWLEATQEFDFEILHRKGRLHSNAGALSCVSDEQCEEDNLPSLVATTAIVTHLNHQIAQLQSEGPVLGPFVASKEQSTYPTIQHNNLESRHLYCVQYL